MALCALGEGVSSRGANVRPSFASPCDLAAADNSAMAPAMLSEHILFIDGEAIIVDKPAGLPVDPPRDGSICVENHLQSLTFGFRRWPVVVHRLDRDTSGCLLLARHPKAAGRFTAAFEARTVAKSYLAVLGGIPDAEAGTISLPLRKISSAERGWRMIGAAAGARDAKAAVSHWEVLAAAQGRALVRFRPETGRTHQLRVHALEGLGHPIVGDPVYGAGGAARRTLLHAETLSLPRDGKPPVAAHAPFPADFAALGFAAPPVPGDG
jgi:tRNA pseudouridine32 synthase / 23S rRNA pseudouridine746 synthase